MTVRGCEHPYDFPGNIDFSYVGGAECGALPAFSTIHNPDLDGLADALNAIPEAERAAVVDHINALARMSPGRRAAILTLTRET